MLCYVQAFGACQYPQVLTPPSNAMLPRLAVLGLGFVHPSNCMTGCKQLQSNLRLRYGVKPYCTFALRSFRYPCYASRGTRELAPLLCFF